MSAPVATDPPLIDWGCAGGAPVPHHEIGELVRSERTSEAELHIFRRAEAPEPGTPEAAADGALRACEALERRAGAYVEREMGRERGATAMAELRRRQREDAIIQVTRMRAERAAQAGR